MERRQSNVAGISWLGEKGVARLSQARGFVFGVGAIGYPLACQLAQLGPEEIVLLDGDRVEEANLGKTPYPEAGVGRPKARVAAEAIRSLNARVRVDAIVGRFPWDFGAGRLRPRGDEPVLVFVCFDNRASTLAAVHAAQSLGLTAINGAIEGESLSACVQVFRPEGGCPACLYTAVDLQLLGRRESCTSWGSTDPEAGVPTLGALGGICAGLMLSEALKLQFLPSHVPVGSYELNLNGLAGGLARTILPRSPGCQRHPRRIARLEELPEEVKVGEALEVAACLLGVPPTEVGLDLGDRVVAWLTCGRCGRKQAIFRLLGRLEEEELACSICGMPRYPELIAHPSGDSPPELLGRTLSELGLPPRAIVSGLSWRGVVDLVLA